MTHHFAHGLLVVYMFKKNVSKYIYKKTEELQVIIFTTILTVIGLHLY